MSQPLFRRSDTLRVRTLPRLPQRPMRRQVHVFVRLLPRVRLGSCSARSFVRVGTMRRRQTSCERKLRTLQQALSSGSCDCWSFCNDGGCPPFSGYLLPAWAVGPAASDVTGLAVTTIEEGSVFTGNGKSVMSVSQRDGLQAMIDWLENLS